jgi:hypothetical protein
MQQFRERGIYVAPDGRSFVASKVRRTDKSGINTLSSIGSELSCFLFDRYQWAFHGTPAFEIAPDGQVFARDGADFGGADQLLDTGSTAGAH